MLDAIVIFSISLSLIGEIHTYDIGDATFNIANSRLCDSFYSDSVVNNNENHSLNNNSQAIKSIQNQYECDDFCNGHGQNKYLGYNSGYLDNCRNWSSIPNYTYGSTDMPYWINMTSFNNIPNELHKNTLINDIRYQISIWNSVKFGQESSQIMNFYEVGIGSTSRPNDINGRKVLEFNCEFNSTIESGHFDPSLISITINYNTSGDGLRPGRHLDTPLHEIGHFLGLGDLDASENIPDGTHISLMGYDRNTDENNLESAIKYSDIQGVVFLNGIHTTHRFDRMFYNNDNYYHVCFYCDMIDRQLLPYPNAEIFTANYACLEHDYEEIFSLDEKCWLRCINCYNTIEHTHLYQDTYVSINENYHEAFCNCGDSIFEDHDFHNHYCVFCSQFTTLHDYHEPYLWYDLKKHYAFCNCGASVLRGHLIYNPIMADNEQTESRYLQCVLCGGNAEIGFSPSV